MPQLDITIISTQVFWLFILFLLFYYVILTIILPIIYQVLSLRSYILRSQALNLVDFNIWKSKWNKLYNKYFYFIFLETVFDFLSSLTLTIQLDNFFLSNKIYFLNSFTLLKYSIFYLGYCYNTINLKGFSFDLKVRKKSKLI